MRTISRWGYLLLPALLIAACGKETDSSRTAAATVAGQIPPAAPSSVPPKDTVSGAGRLQWTLPGLEERLRSNGLEPVRSGPIKQPFMGPPGMVYRLKSGELQVYIYGDAYAVARDTDKLDTADVAPPTMKINWIMPPSLITENNLAVILLTRDPGLRERVTRAIKAKPTKHGEGRP